MTNSMINFTAIDNHYMNLALELAKQGAEKGEVPVGAVLVQFDESLLRKGGGGEFIEETLSQTVEGIILGQGYNQPILTNDPTAHAEVVALRDACQYIENYRLPSNTTLYVTLEPCTMCVGALIHARLSRLVFATAEPRAGMVGSQANLLEADFYNHKKILVQSGLMAEESSQMLKSFFKERRKAEKARKSNRI